MRIFTLLLLVTLIATSCCNNEGLSVSDFKFDGELGCKGAKIEKVGKNHFRLIPGHAPNHPNWPNMIQFEITGNAKGNNLRLDVDFPAKDATYHFDSYFYSWSHNKISWKPIQWLDYQHSESRRSNTLLFPKFKKDVVYVGHQVPLSYATLKKLIRKWKKNPAVKVNTIGKSIEGRDIYRLTVTNHTVNNQKWVHYFTNQHPGEHNAQWRMAGMLEWLISKKGKDYLNNSINHFIFIMYPDGPTNGWYRTGVEGVDGNRAYLHTGADKGLQAHEAYICQKDLEDLMESDKPVTALWTMHTWGGAVEPIMVLGPEFGEEAGEWEEFRETIKNNDDSLLIEPIRVNRGPDFGDNRKWQYGSHAQFGITTVLCEGSGNFHTKEKNIESGEVLIKSISEFYK
jgi:hypothetical protein